MKKHRRFLAMGLICISLLLSGCGTPLYELTADEEALIVKYAAHFVAKHNIYQKDGISIEVAEDETVEDESQTPDDSQDPGQGEVDKIPSVAEAMNLPKGISLTYVEGYVTDHITVPGYSVSAGDDFSFYVLKFQMKNNTEEAIEVDILGKNITFQLTSGKVVTKEKEDPIVSFTQYIDTVAAGDSQDVLLLFRVKTSDAEKISEPTIEMLDGETKEPVKL